MKDKRPEKPNIYDVYDYYGLVITGRDHGAWRKAQCPLPEHDDKNPSASVNEEWDRWACHACDKTGDGFDIIREREGLDTFGECIEFAKRFRPKAPVSGARAKSPHTKRPQGAFVAPWRRMG